MSVKIGFIGNQRQIAGLRRAVDAGRAHAFLLYGAEHLGKRTAVELLSREILHTNDLATHPDALIVEPDRDKNNPTISIEEIRRVRQFLNVSPFIAEVKVVIIDGAERMTKAAANALLKSLEEPPGRAVLFLIAQDLGAVLKTIQSRSLPVRFTPVKAETIANALGVPVDSAAVRLANGRPGLALRLREDSEVRAALTRRFDAVKKLLVASPSVRLSYIARVLKQAPEAFHELPQQWLIALEDLVRSGNEGAVHLARSLFNVTGTISSTNARPELLVESALLQLPQTLHPKP